MKRLITSILLTAYLLLGITSAPALAQTYYFSVDEEIVDVYWESDGSMRIEYIIVFTNDQSASPIEFVDIGLPSYDYNTSNIYGWINEIQIQHVAHSEYVSPGIELGLESNAIPPGKTGEVKVSIGQVGGVLYDDDDDSEYASANFAPNFFGSQYVFGTTDLTVIFHLPPGVQPEEPRWHSSPPGFPDEPETGLDSEGRIVYIWRNRSANAHTMYVFGASFPRSYVPTGVISKPVPEGAEFQPSPPSGLRIPSDAIFGCLCVGSIVLLIFGFVALAIFSDRRRKLAYLPPKMSIEGHGIKRGLTAVEAAVLLETPLDRVLTMILFSVIKKGAAQVTTEKPLKIDRITPQPEGLRPYEEDFLKAMIDETPRKRRTALQKVMITLVKSAQKKMKGFSLRETKNYYKAIMKKAWQQVEEAKTPEIRSKLFDEGLEWTMLDREFDDRTRRVFRTGPVYVPMWWGRYRPSTVPTSRPSTTTPSTRGPGPSVSLPQLPGAEFAASMVTGVQDAASSMVSNVLGFTNGVTKTTNPPPPPSRSRSGWSSGGGSGCACACACACAGCACACAGGGR